ncbi:rCG63354, partial [Rattus norvegicus]
MPEENVFNLYSFSKRFIASYHKEKQNNRKRKECMLHMNKMKLAVHDGSNPEIPILQRLRQEDHEFQTSLSTYSSSKEKEMKG